MLLRFWSLCLCGEVRDYSPKVFEQLLLSCGRRPVRRAWLWTAKVMKSCPTSGTRWRGVERSFKMAHGKRFPELAATVDAMNGNDKARWHFLSNGQRELAAFVDACKTDRRHYVARQNREKGLLLIARRTRSNAGRSRDKNFFWGFELESLPLSAGRSR